MRSMSCPARRAAVAKPCGVIKSGGTTLQLKASNTDQKLADSIAEQR
jgi:hypothetical protein